MSLSKQGEDWASPDEAEEDSDQDNPRTLEVPGIRLKALSPSGDTG